jgi:hypothetical protein
MEEFIFADVALARRLERAEAWGNVEFVESRARFSPALGACWTGIAGAYAMYDGPDSPVTQTFGLGMFGEVTTADLEELENFFRSRGAKVFHEVSPLADVALATLLSRRGYGPVEFTSVMFRPLRPNAGVEPQRSGRISVRTIAEHEQELWARTAERGWAEFPQVAPLMFEFGLVSAARPGALSFLAEEDGRPIASGALSICEGVALLAGASTVPEGRRRGAQLALLDARLRAAAARGCDLAMMCALPGSASQRNAERQGFRIAYTRIKWGLLEEQDAAHP